MDVGNRIPDSIISELRDRCDIVDYISRYVNLKKRGSNYVGLCPFHKERTPSFVVSREKKIFHCFGCGEGGSLFNFLSKIESKNFYQIVKELAQENGIKIDADYELDESSTKKKRLYSICFEAMRYYNEQLYSKEGDACLSYLKARGITENLIMEHNLGYSPQNGENLFNKLIKLGFSQEDILDAGIFTKSHGTIQDRFSNRLIIPLIDQNKKTIGFAGRSLDESTNTAKYINSPESQIFHKSSFLFGLNIASAHIHKSNFLIVVEGYFDLISLNSINFFNVVATCGTALTQSHIRHLKRLSKDIILCFDGDSAGKSAVYKAAKVLLPSGLNIYVITLPKGEDPDSFARNNGHNAFTELIKNRTPFFRYLAEDFNIATKKNPHLRTNLIKKMLGYIQILPDIIEQREAIKTISQISNLEEDVIYSYLKNTQSFIPHNQSILSTQTTKKHKSYEIWFIAILVQFPQLIENLPDDIIDTIQSSDILEAYKEIISLYNNNNNNILPIITNNPSLSSEITEVMMNKSFPENETDAFSILIDCLYRLQIERLKQEVKDIDKKIILAQKSGDEKLTDILIKKKIELSKSIRLREI